MKLNGVYIGGNAPSSASSLLIFVKTVYLLINII